MQEIKNLDEIIKELQEADCYLVLIGKRFRGDGLNNKGFMFGNHVDGLLLLSGALKNIAEDAGEDKKQALNAYLKSISKIIMAQWEEMGKCKQ